VKEKDLLFGENVGGCVAESDEQIDLHVFMCACACVCTFSEKKERAREKERKIERLCVCMRERDLLFGENVGGKVAVSCSVLQCVAVCRSVLQCVGKTVLQRGANKV